MTRPHTIVTRFAPSDEVWHVVRLRDAPCGECGTMSTGSWGVEKAAVYSLAIYDYGDSVDTKIQTQAGGEFYPESSFSRGKGTAEDQADAMNEREAQDAS